MKYILILLLTAFYASILTVSKNTILKNTKTKHVLFMQYLSGIIILLIINSIFYFLENPFSIKKEDLNEIFDYKNKNIWLFSIITSILGYIYIYYYYESLKNLGPSQTTIIFAVSKTLFVLILSIFILKNRILNYKTYLGILLGLISLYLLNQTNNNI